MDNALPRCSVGTAPAIYACRDIIQKAKLAPAANRAMNSIEKLGLLAAAIAATANSRMPTSIVRHIPNLETSIPAGTSHDRVPMCLAPTASPTRASVAYSSSRANMGRTGMSTPCPNESRNDGA